MEVSTTSSVDVDECLLLSTSATFEFVLLRKAQQCNKAGQNVVLQRIGDPNVLPFIHFTLVFMQQIFNAIYSNCTTRQTAISTNPCGLLNRCKHHPYSPFQCPGSRLALYLQVQKLLGTPLHSCPSASPLSVQLASALRTLRECPQ